MIRLTDRATEELKDILATNQTPEDRGVKLVPGEAGGVAMIIDRAREGDDVVDGEQRPLLIVDASIAGRLDGVTLDASSEGPEGDGPRFFLRTSDKG
jgi:Fe-S cluster assembly iron-binding protein IscA